MDTTRTSRSLDLLLTAGLAAAAVLLAVEDVTAGPDADVAHALDSHSWLLVPVFVAAVLPVLWRRRHVLVALAVSIAVVAASVPAFGWVTRCGFALPLSLAFAYAVARFAGRRPAPQLLGALGVLALQVVTLVRDSATGGLGGALPLAVPCAALAYGIGWFVNSRARRRGVRPTLSPEHVHA